MATSKKVEKPEDRPVNRQLAHARYINHWADELTLQELSGSCPPACDKKARALRDALRDYAYAMGGASNLFIMDQRAAKRVGAAKEKLDNATTTEDREEAQQEFDQEEATYEENHAAWQEAQKKCDDAADKASKAEKKLQKCRKQNPCTGRCGPRGGVGIPRPDGKCAGWKDWRDKEGNYY